MGNRPATGICGGAAAQQCVDECARIQFELDGKSREDPDCDPAGAVFNETVQGLNQLDSQALCFAGASNLSAVRWLLTMGTSLNARDRNGTTLLHAACRSGSGSIVQELLRRRLPLDAVDSAGWTALHIAAVMGRREIAMMLLQAQANPTLKNKRGKMALDVCSDPGTKEVLTQFGAAVDGGVMRPPGQSQRSDTGTDRWLSHVTGPVGQDDMATCEPFFVPRSPLFHDELHRQELKYLGIELFNQGAGHGLAFFVATGVVHDHPSDLASFVVRLKADESQLASFLGEDVSLAQTLRLAFIHSVDLTGTGVVSALVKAFENMRAPSDLQKIDRITSGVALLWWRVHDLDGSEDVDPDAESAGWRIFVEDPTGSNTSKTGVREVSGLELRRCVHSVEGLRRLMFSTVMLFWNMYESPAAFPASTTPWRLSLSGWLDMNVGLEADGSDVSVHVQKSIYDKVAEQPQPQLLPDLSTRSSRSSHRTQPDGGEFATPTPARQNVVQETRSDWISSLARKDNAMLVKGWASIPWGGLERQEPAFASGRQTLAHCILSETSGLPSDQMEAPGTDEGQTVWLSLRFRLFLFLSTSPNETPYAFVRLQDAVLREVRKVDHQLIIAGRQRPIADEDVAENGGGGNRASPFGDSCRLPLQLCFLLADGRFQPFEALWLELQFKSEDDVLMWSNALEAACDLKLQQGEVMDDQPNERQEGLAEPSAPGRGSIGPLGPRGPVEPTRPRFPGMSAEASIRPPPPPRPPGLASKEAPAKLVSPPSTGSRSPKAGPNRPHQTVRRTASGGPVASAPQEGLEGPRPAG
mmetsp:Transcript_107626/g.303100  ORF Transcript_107626/g.303100 Transcript_107626/m.303100 type:complete len:811 (+) Transcript_107626:128-2560(+)|eukprot:CAMPEP_0117463024 /NCGR_PEP_ID=MMETSP0784-20121206/3358_1 /TAXON_ID=39447 /ORGANISM="" /LENGTH=810 /DNA_ID=CAMNT_0005256811 /DNA_START=84 /DNA_END=2516 /DNA_ORIENTATION=+